MYISSVVLTTIIIPFYFRKRGLLGIFALFSLLSVFLAYYSYIYSPEKRVFLIILSALSWFSPIASFMSNLVSIRASFDTKFSEKSLSKLVYGCLMRRPWRIRCHDKNYVKFLVAGNFFNTNLKITNSSIVFYSRVNKGVLNILRLLFGILVGYLSYALYVYYLERDIVKLATSLSIVSVIMIIFIGTLFNLYGFLESHHNEVISLVKREIRRVTDILSIAEAIKIAKKFKKQG